MAPQGWSRNYCLHESFVSLRCTLFPIHSEGIPEWNVACGYWFVRGCHCRDLSREPWRAFFAADKSKGLVAIIRHILRVIQSASHTKVRILVWRSRMGKDHPPRYFPGDTNGNLSPIPRVRIFAPVIPIHIALHIYLPFLRFAFWVVNVELSTGLEIEIKWRRNVLVISVGFDLEIMPHNRGALLGIITHHYVPRKLDRRHCGIRTAGRKRGKIRFKWPIQIGRIFRDKFRTFLNGYATFALCNLQL